MRAKRLITILITITSASALIVAPLYAAPGKNKDNHDKGKNQVIHQKKESDHYKKSPHNKRNDKSKRDTGILKKIGHSKNIHKSNEERMIHIPPDVYTPEKNKYHSTITNYDKNLLKRLDQSLRKLDNTHWANHPKDDRSQGNRSFLEMLSPFGHDRDSDRKELHGNRGRVVKVPVQAPDPIPEPLPEPDPVPEPDPIPKPDPIPEPDPDPIPDFPF